MNIRADRQVLSQIGKHKTAFDTNCSLYICLLLRPCYSKDVIIQTPPHCSRLTTRNTNKTMFCLRSWVPLLIFLYLNIQLCVWQASYLQLDTERTPPQFTSSSSSQQRTPFNVLVSTAPSSSSSSSSPSSTSPQTGSSRDGLQPPCHPRKRRQRILTATRRLRRR